MCIVSMCFLLEPPLRKGIKALSIKLKGKHRMSYSSPYFIKTPIRVVLPCADIKAADHSPCRNIEKKTFPLSQG